jgi:acyl-CoA dehydrogenase
MTEQTSTLSDADRQLLRDSVRDFLASRWPAEHAVERSTDTGAIGAAWKDMSAQGLTALGADPAEGGLREILLVMEELGRAACPVPMLGAVVTNVLLAKAGGAKSATELLDRIAQGAARVCVAFGAFDGDESAGSVKVNDGRIDGTVRFLEDAAGATHFVALCDAPAGVAIVAADAGGVKITETPGMARPSLSEVTFTKAPASVIPVERSQLEAAAVVSRLACASRALGAAQRAFDLAVDHAKVRKQFDQLIGSFQAIQHKLANSLINLEGTRLLLVQAADAHDGGSPDWRVFASAAFAFAGPALREVAVQNQRALGAIGYAEEHEAPRHFRRVHTDVARFGGVVRARNDLADYLLGAKS